ncbi:hypothetical protein KR084_011071 [Drosophila pseudotakahashii]|nr:hypothetical protein KR084_011071 [Drosophila pseudotakahashii]
MHSPITPVTSRCGFLRSRKRINPHPISQLISLPKTKKCEKLSKVDTENANANPEDMHHLTKPDTSPKLKAQPTRTDEGNDVSQEIRNR